MNLNHIKSITNEKGGLLHTVDVKRFTFLNFCYVLTFFKRFVNFSNNVFNFSNVFNIKNVSTDVTQNSI